MDPVLILQRQKSKPANFGAPVGGCIPLEVAEWMYFVALLLVEERWRCEYTRERADPEWVDHGGES